MNNPVHPCLDITIAKSGGRLLWHWSLGAAVLMEMVNVFHRYFGKTTCPQADREKLAWKQSSRSTGFRLGVRSKNACKEELLLCFMHVPRKYRLGETRVYPTWH